MERELTNLLAPNQKTIDFLRITAKIGSLIVLVIGITSLILGYFNVSLFVRILPNVIGMRPLIAVGFICASCGLLLHLTDNSESSMTGKSAGAFLLSSLTLILGFIPFLFTFFQKLIGGSSLTLLTTLYGNNISLDISFIFIGVALLLMPIPAGRHYMRLAHILTLLVALLSMFAIISYLYQALSYFSFFPLTAMSLSSALTFTLLCLSLLIANPSRGYAKVFTRNTPSSILALRLLIIILTLPATLGYLVLIGEQLRFYDPQTGLTVFVVSSISLFVIAVWINTSALQRVELENLIIKNELEKRNVTLEVDAQSLATKMMTLEEEKKEVDDKLSNRDKLLDIADNSL